MLKLIGIFGAMQFHRTYANNIKIWWHSKYHSYYW